MKRIWITAISLIVAGMVVWASAPESISGSKLVFDPGFGGDESWYASSTQTFYFAADSYTDDYEYVIGLWLRFPSGWTVTNVAIIGTPVCTGGGSWGTFSWATGSTPNEVVITHNREQESTDHCTAYYAVTVTTGAGTGPAYVSWYWNGDGFGDPPHFPCSSDSYTPSGCDTCDQAVEPPAQIPAGTLGVSLHVTPNARKSCVGTTVTYPFTLTNRTGAAATFNISVSGNAWTVDHPATVGPVAYGVTAPFDLTHQIPGGAAEGASDTPVVTVTDQLNPGYNASKGVTTKSSSMSWTTVAGSAPSWAGNGFPSRGCTALNASSQWCTYIIGDATGTGPVGFWCYNHSTNAWSQPVASNTPADRWAASWAYDPGTNLCYLTGGCQSPWTGTFSEAYMYDPFANSFTSLPGFTTGRYYHASWVGKIDGVKYLVVGGGAGLSSTQCFNLATGSWKPENEQMGAYPFGGRTGAAEGLVSVATGDRFWLASGDDAGNNLVSTAYYFDDMDHSWHAAGSVPAPVRRSAGAVFNGDLYVLGGSGESGTVSTVQRCHSGTWSVVSDMPHARKDLVAGIGEHGLIWVVDGNGAAGSNYVDILAPCSTCAPPGAPMITAINDNSCGEVTIEFTAGASATRHHLYIDSRAVASDVASPFDYAPGNTASHTYVVRAVIEECYTDSAPYPFSAAMNIPSPPVITSIVDLYPSSLSGLQINYTESPPSVQHDLYVDGVLAVADFASGTTYEPGDSEVHAFVIKACWQGSAVMLGRDLLVAPVMAWGYNNEGQLGDASNTNSNLPVPVSNLSGVADIAGGASHSLALKSDGTVMAWGYNSSGQLGNGNNLDSNVPVQVLNLTGVVAISAGREHSLALKSDGTVRAWGHNYEGQLGDGGNDDSNLPVEVWGLAGIVAVAGGEKHSLALKNDGTVWAWGLNDMGQLGDGSYGNANVPVQVLNLTNIVAVAAGANHSMAIKSDGTVWTWGNNMEGELGDGNWEVSRNVPDQALNLTNVTAIAGGVIYSLALDSGGNVWIWGNDSLGSYGNANVPALQGLAGVASISAGGFHPLVLKNDGTVWAWWNNNEGELGDGTWNWASDPVQALNITNATAIAGGWRHSLAILDCQPPPEVANGSSPDDIQSWSADNGTMSWPAAPGIVDHYIVYRGVVSELADLINSNPDFCERALPANTSFILTGDDDPANLDPVNRCLFYLVTAHNSYGEGPSGNALIDGVDTPRTVNKRADCH